MSIYVNITMIKKNLTFEIYVSIMTVSDFYYIIQFKLHLNINKICRCLSKRSNNGIMHE
jgi:hypothetical protein